MCARLFEKKLQDNNPKDPLFHEKFVSLRELSYHDWGEGVYQSRFKVSPSGKPSNGNAIEEREIFVYLPDQYFEEPERNYRVLYVLDGQNAFNDPYCGMGDHEGWQLNLLTAALSNHKIIEPIIIVAIKHGISRMAEDLPPPHPKSMGLDLINYIINDIKLSLIDKVLRTRPEAKNTAILGSSLAALIPFLAHMEYSHIFGLSGVFSPSFWLLALPEDMKDLALQDKKKEIEDYFGDKLKEEDAKRMFSYIKEPEQLNARLYIYVGGVQNPDPEKEADFSDGNYFSSKMVAELRNQAWGNDGYLIDKWVPGALHDEEHWNKAADGFIRIFSPGPNVNATFRHPHIKKRPQRNTHINVQ